MSSIHGPGAATMIRDPEAGMPTLRSRANAIDATRSVVTTVMPSVLCAQIGQDFPNLEATPFRGHSTQLADSVTKDQETLTVHQEHMRTRYAESVFLLSLLKPAGHGETVDGLSRIRTALRPQCGVMPDASVWSVLRIGAGVSPRIVVPGVVRTNVRMNSIAYGTRPLVSYNATNLIVRRGRIGMMTTVNA
jgi:hypothetical protein